MPTGGRSSVFQLNEGALRVALPKLANSVPSSGPLSRADSGDRRGTVPRRNQANRRFPDFATPDLFRRGQ